MLYIKIDDAMKANAGNKTGLLYEYVCGEKKALVADRDCRLAVHMSCPTDWPCCESYKDRLRLLVALNTNADAPDERGFITCGLKEFSKANTLPLTSVRKAHHAGVDGDSGDMMLDTLGALLAPEAKEEACREACIGLALDYDLSPELCKLLFTGLDYCEIGGEDPTDMDTVDPATRDAEADAATEERRMSSIMAARLKHLYSMERTDAEAAASNEHVWALGCKDTEEAVWHEDQATLERTYAAVLEHLEDSVC